LSQRSLQWFTSRFLELRDVGRRWRRRGIEQILEDPFPPFDGRSARRVRRDREHAGMTQKAPPLAGCERHALKLFSLNPLDAVMLRQPFVDEREIRIQKFENAAVLADDAIEK